MTRPPSIVRFDRLYLASIAIGLVNAIVFWSFNRDMVLAMPQVQASPGLAGTITVLMIVSLVVNLGVSLLFWWLVTRARNVVGKWLVAVTEGIGVLLALFSLLRLVQGTAPNVPSALLALLSTALAVAAAAMLFRPDADAWFATGDPEPMV